MEAVKPLVTYSLNNNQSRLPAGIRVLVYLLSIILTFQPALLHAGSVVVDQSGSSNRPELGEAANGVPVVNIARPSSGGVSHNRFTQFNVNREGLILNNSARVAQSQLGGAVNANDHLRAGQEAQLILNEVTAANRSRLEGYTEIAGRSAEYILANPYGITCNGCGFINTPNVTLTTGQPQMSNGLLGGLSVNGGDIVIEGLGLNASNVDHFQIITRALELNAELYAQRLDVTLGRNDIDWNTKAVTAKTDAGGKPAFALDASALGAMYAGQIQLIGTEAGVGVRMAGDLAADAGDIRMNVDGSISLAQTQSSRDIQLISGSGDIRLNGLTYAGSDLDVTAAGQVDITDFSAAKNDATINANRINQQGSLVAGLNEDYSLNPNGDLSLTANDAIDNSGVIAVSGRANIKGGAITNSGRLETAYGLQFNAASLNNDGGYIFDASNSGTNIQLSGAFSNVSGQLHSNSNNLTLTAASFDNRDGRLIHTGEIESVLNITGSLINRRGLLQSDASTVNMTAQSLLNSDGQILHAGNDGLQLTVAGQWLNENGVLHSNAAMKLAGNTLNNQGGFISSSRQLTLDIASALDNSVLAATGQGGLLEASNQITLSGGNVNNAGGRIRSIGLDPLFDTTRLTIDGAFDNRGGVVEAGNAALSITASGIIDNRDAGVILHSGYDALTITANDVDTAGISSAQIARIVSHGRLDINADRVYNRAFSLLSSNDDLSLQATRLLDNQSDISTGAALEIHVTLGNINNSGTLTAEGINDSSILAANGLNNNGGSIWANAVNLIIAAGSGDILNDNGAIAHSGSGILTLSGSNLLNRNSGKIASSAGLNLTGFDNLSNMDNATLLAQEMQLAATTIDNTRSNIYMLGGDVLQLNASNFVNDDGMVNSAGNITATLGGLSNSQGVMQSQQNFELSLDAFSGNQSDARINAGNHLTLNLTNGLNVGSGIELVAFNDFTINANGDVDNQGTISTGRDLVMSGAHLINRSGAIISADRNLNFNFSGNIDNENTAVLSAANDLQLTALRFTNRGLVAAGNTLHATAANLDNYNTLFAGNHLNAYVSGDLRNFSGADIFAMNNIHIAADSDTTRSNTILNESGTIEAYNGDITLYANTIENRHAAGALLGSQNISVIEQAATFPSSFYTDSGGGASPASVGTSCGSSGNIRRFCKNEVEAYQQEYLLSDVPAAAQMIAGGAIQAGFGHLSNSNSHIAANASMNLQGDTLTNSGTAVRRYTRTNRMRQSYGQTGSETIFVGAGGGTVITRTTYGRSGSPVNTGAVGYNTRATDYATSTLYSGGSFTANISDGLSNINGGDSGVNSNRSAPSQQNQNTSATTQDLMSVTPVIAPGTTDHIAVSETLGNSVSAVDGLQRLVFNPADHLNLPGQGGLFITNTDPGTNYLVETNPALLDLGFFDSATGEPLFQGTDALLTHLPVDQEITTRRLGDAFYETRLIREAVFEVTGQRYLDESIKSDYQQMQYLMNNAIAAQQPLQLSVGIALSSEQAAQLTHDIIWLEQQEIQGHQVLVPVYYAASLRHGDINKSGALILGESVQLTVDDGGVVNLGTMSAKDQLNIDAARSVLNQGIIHADHNLNLTAGDSLKNLRGHIKTDANGQLLLVARNRISNNDGSVIEGGFLQLTAEQGGLQNHKSLLQAQHQLGVKVREDINLNSDNGRFESAGDMQLQSTGGHITVGNTDPDDRYRLSAGGDLALLAEHDININDSDVNAGGSLTLSGDDVNLNARQTKIERGNDYYKMRRVTHSVSKLSAGGNNLKITAQDDITSEGAHLKAGNDIALSAKDDIDLQAVHDEDYYFQQNTQKKSFGRKKTNIYESQKITADGTQLKASGNIRINVDDDGKRLDSGDVALEGSTLAAGDDVLVAADGDINVYAAQTYNMQRSETHKQSLGGLKKKSTGSRNERSGLKSSTLKATNDLSAISGNNITIVASDLESGGNTVLAAEKEILISAGADTEQQSTWSLESDVMSGGDFYSIDANVAGTSSVKARRSNVQAGGDINITAGSAKVVGSNLNAGNDITATTTTGDLDILATQDKTEHYSRDVSAGLSFSDMFAFNGQSSNESFEKMIDGSGDLNNTDKVIVWDNKGQPQINNLSLISNDANSQSSQTRSIGSQLTAGNNINVHSFNDLTSEATQFKAGHDIALSAQENINLKAAHNEDHHVEQNTQKGSFDKQKTDIVEDHIITAEGNQLNAGANIRINVDALGHQQDSGDVSFEGSQLNAGKDVLLAADGDINVYAAQTYELHREEHHKKSTLGLKKDNVGERNERQGLDGSTLKATDDLSVLSGNDITIVASDVNSGGDTHLEAFNNVLISAGEEVEKTESWTEKSNTFSDGKLYSLDEEREGEASIKAQSSHVQAGGNITLTAGRAKVVGSNLTAGGSIEAKTDIGDIEILAAKETSESFSHEKHVSASIADAMGNPDDIIQDDEEGKLKLKLADAVYDDEKTRTSKIEHTSSELVANEDITLEAIGDLLIEGSNIIADADRNQIGDVNLTAEENIIIQEAENLLTKIKEEKHGEAVLSFVVQHQAIEVIRALKNVKDAKKQVKQAQEDYRAYKKDIKRLEVELAAIAQDYKDKTSGITYDDVVEMREIVEETKDDEDWYKAGVVAAAANMAAKVTAVVQQTVALAQSTGTYGFNAGVQLDVKGSKSRTEEHQSTSLASNIVGQNITIQTGGDEAQGSQTTIQGSHLQANNAINIDTGQLNIQASKDRYQMTKDTESIEISVQQTVYGAAGGPSVSGSLERSRDKAAETTYNNSTLNANNISLNSTDDTNIRGANVHANEQLIVDVGGDLNVESKQNRSRSSSVGASISGGFSFGGAEGDQASGTKSAAENGKSFSGAAKNLANLGGSNGKVSSVNVGASSSNSRSRSKETVLTSLTSGGSADINVKKNTHITGALIATQDENGKDLGNLNLTTKTLTYADLNNVNESSSRSTGISTSVGINSSANPADPAQQDAPDAQGEDNLRVNTTNIQHSNSSHYDKSKTLATLGQGNITIADEDNSDDLDRLNRDVDNVDKDIVSIDRQQGNIDLTIDHRMLSEEGRAEIVNDFKETIKGAGRVGDSIQEVWGSITNGEVSAEEAATIEQWANDKRGQIALALETGSSVTENKQIHYYTDNNGGMVAVDWNQFLASEGARDILRNALALQIEEEGSLRGSPNYQQIREDFNYYSDRVLDSDAITDAVSYFSGANLITRIGAESLKGAGKVLDNIFSRSPSPTINPRIYDGELGAVADAKSITQVTDEMKANPYHKDWQNYVGKEHRAVGADVVKPPSVNKMDEFFEMDFGANLKELSQKTTKHFQGQSVYKIDQRSGEFAKGDQFYLDNLHKDHIEVFDKRGNFKGVYNLDGSKNLDKTEKAFKDGRKLPKN